MATQLLSQGPNNIFGQPSWSQYGDPTGDVQQQNAQAQQSWASSVSPGLAQLVTNYNQAFTQAKNANEARYQQMLNIANQTTGQQAADIRTQYAQQNSAQQQQLNRTGLGNTTIGATLQQGNQAQQSMSMNRLADTMQQTKLGIIGSKQDQYPNLGSLQSILTGLSSGGGQYGIDSLVKALGSIKS